MKEYYKKIKQQIEDLDNEINKIDNGFERDHELEEEIVKDLKEIAKKAESYKNFLIKKYKR